ncbi:ABC-2 family transporter protein [Clostridium tagluense]|uniref:ABC transporter permease n=1 Tax=Clostridium tagluense TaxID=360422 RepID=UPI001C0C6BC3|nr:ABC-2 family transporter protein [Clostridium tagluense]MBU3127832.1 ABC-2 family transporter protein [Clostridium tagluense]MCB2310141.1 ABC-2 family transporter protein [Clostridium tagluense]MCB2315217.1 ABC-2 family transporter protein [Clostridium tagluense]MCB2319841.1 ABC-2 family transporter protein [Clostridium tagluense]MCB2324960.1 ABC-2 family transporter protein [Clostridium tagluense]
MKVLLKYGQISKITMSNSLVYFWNFLSKNIFFVFIMFIYLMLWKNIYAQKGSTIAGLSLNAMIWYLIVTELVTLSRTDIHVQVNEDVKSGNIAYLLNKPYNYVIYCFSYFVGEIGIKLLTNGIIGLSIGFIYAGTLENFNVLHLPFIFLSLIVGCCINFFIYITLALTSFWFEDNTAFFWIYSKLIFTLGGMLMPIELFPDWLQKISKYLPFAYVTYVPAKLAVDFSLSNFYKQFSIQLLYLGIFFTLAMTLYKKGAKNLNVNGG